MLGFQPVGARGRFDGEGGEVGVLLEPGQAVLPAQFDHAEFLRALDQETFNVELLDVDERWLAGEMEVALLAQIKAVHLVVAREGAAHAPLHALGRDAFKNAQPLEDLQRFLRVADAAR